MGHRKSVIGIIDDSQKAESLVETLVSRGILAQDVSVLLPDKSGTRAFAHEKHTKAPEGAITGVGAGGVAGGAFGLLVGLGAITIPGLGPLVAAGPLLAAMSGAAAGAAVGGVTGALMGLGVPEIEAKVFEDRLKGGNILVAVHVADHEERDRVKEVLEGFGAMKISVVGEKRAA